MSEPEVTTKETVEDVLHPIWQHEHEDGTTLTLEYQGMTLQASAWSQEPPDANVRFLKAFRGLEHELEWELARQRGLGHDAQNSGDDE